MNVVNALIRSEIQNSIRNNGIAEMYSQSSNLNYLYKNKQLDQNQNKNQITLTLGLNNNVFPERGD